LDITFMQPSETDFRPDAFNYSLAIVPAVQSWDSDAVPQPN
jgi:hypothetical protein